MGASGPASWAFQLGSELTAPLCILNMWLFQVQGQPGENWNSASFQDRQLAPLASDTWLPDIYSAALVPPPGAGENKQGALWFPSEELHSWAMSLTLG